MAREKYLMKKSNEDIYIFEEDVDDNIRRERVKEQPDCRQLHLADLDCSPLYREREPGFEKLELADTMADSIRARYGIDSLKRAVFVKQAAMVDHMSGGITRDKMDVDYSRETVL